jgi:hypothetical protein
MHATSPTQEYIIADGDSDDRSTDPYNRQAFRDEAGDEVAMPWFGSGPFDEIKVSKACGCTESGKNQDATQYALRLHVGIDGIDGIKWRFRCNDQKGYAMCQPGGAHQKCGGGVCQ